MIANLIAFVGSLIFVGFAVIIQGFISMATPIGPWIEPIVALFMLLLVRGVLLVFKRVEAAQGARVACLVTAAAGVGGAVSTAFGFSFPTLYFLDRALFNSWMASPFYVAFFAFGMTMVSGALAFLLVYFLETKTLNDTAMPFPIGQMVGRILSVAQEIRHSITLVIGFVSTFVLSITQLLWRFIPQSIALYSGGTWSIFHLSALVIQTNLVLVFLAIGFIAGSLLVVPLIVGVFSKIIFIEPIQRIFFSTMPFKTFLIAFAGGIMLQEALLSLVKMPAFLMKAFRYSKQSVQEEKERDQAGLSLWRKSRSVFWLVLTSGIGIVYFWWFEFSVPSQVYLYLFTIICVQQALVIGGKAGMAPMGRYATFVMLPGLLLFHYSNVQAMMVSLFVWLVGMLTVDLFFGRVAGKIVKVDRRAIIIFQVIGLIVSALMVGLLFWLLISTFGLDSPELCAQRAQARALLITAWQFPPLILLLGAFFGFILQRLKINPILVFTGLLVPEQFSLLLVLGGAMALFVQNRAEWEPFWSGVFAAGSLAMLIKVFI